MESSNASSSWSPRVEGILTDASLEYDLPVASTEISQTAEGDGEAQTPARTKIDPVKQEKSEKAINLIILNVGDQVLRKIINCGTTTEMWSTLERLYLSKSLPHEDHHDEMWLKGLLSELGYEQRTIKVWCDSQSAICLSKNSVHHERTKHIDVKYHFIRKIIASEEIGVEKIPTSENPVDILTKVVPVSKFKKALSLLKLN